MYIISIWIFMIILTARRTLMWLMIFLAVLCLTGHHELSVYSFLVINIPVFSFLFPSFSRMIKASRLLVLSFELFRIAMYAVGSAYPS